MQHVRVKLKNCSPEIQTIVDEWKCDVQSGGVAAALVTRDPKWLAPRLAELKIVLNTEANSVSISGEDAILPSEGTDPDEWSSMIDLDTGTREYYDV
jgi:hypothetical protein